MGVDMKLQHSLRTAWMVNQAWHFDGFFGMIVEGQQRTGKSSFVCQVGAEAFGSWSYEEDSAVCKEHDYEAVKPWMVFLPEEFLGIVLKVGIGKKYKLIIWDDAGFWLFVLDWYEPFVKTVAKYIQLAGRQFASVLLTTPSQNMISSKVLEALPELYVCKIVKEGKDRPDDRPRVAKVYQRWSYPDGHKGGVRWRWKDHFNAMLPDEFWEWYKPRSDDYMKAGMNLLNREVTKITEQLSKKEEADFMEEVYKVAGSEDRLKQVQEVIDQLGEANPKK
jgi:hypothetical protein